MSVTGCFFWTVLPPSFSMFFNEASMSGTSTVMTVFLTSLLRFVSPPLMAPGCVGIRVFGSNLSGSDHVVFHSGVLANVPSEGFLVEDLCAFLVVGRYLKVHDSCVMHIPHLSGSALKWANKYSLYFTSLDQAFPFRSQNS